uniref:Maf-like protein n=1 Tax=Leersia perrieri TaxID=77586 RepID=A0A0D9XT00_9ORYZ
MKMANMQISQLGRWPGFIPAHPNKPSSSSTSPESLLHNSHPHLLATPTPPRLSSSSPEQKLGSSRGELLMAAASIPANPQPFKLILGSSSVARKHILTEMGLQFEVMTADIDEKSIRREDPDELVTVLAEAKADAIISRLNIADYQKEGDLPTLLITSDIVVVHEGIIREKPTTKEEARQFLNGYSGGHVSTVGSVVVTNLTTGKRFGSLDKAEVYFHDIPDEVIENLNEASFGIPFRPSIQSRSSPPKYGP